MSEWHTYALSDFLLFSPRTFYRLLELYNLAVWPLHLLALALGVAVLVLLRRGGADDGRSAGRMVAAILSACWAWVAWAYHVERYATINWAADWLAAGFGAQAALLLWTGAARGELVVGPAADSSRRAGFALILFAVALQPLIGPLAGRSWTQVEVFGIAPDPTAVATLGALLCVGRRVPWATLLLPVLWCALSGATSWTMESPDAAVLPAAAAAALGIAAWRSCGRG